MITLCLIPALPSRFICLAIFETAALSYLTSITLKGQTQALLLLHEAA